MSKEDEFWFWTMYAITDLSLNNQYYYDNMHDVLFGFKIDGKKKQPILRNNFSFNILITKKIDEINSLILKLTENNKQFLQLPKITIEEKLNFINVFCKEKGIESVEIKNDLLNALYFNNYDLLIENFDFQKRVFFANKVKEKYFTLGIHEKSRLLW